MGHINGLHHIYFCLKFFSCYEGFGNFACIHLFCVCVCVIEHNFNYCEYFPFLGIVKLIVLLENAQV